MLRAGSVLEEDVAGETVCHLIGEDLLVDGPAQRLAHLVPQVSDSLHRCIFRVVRVHDADKVILGEGLELVEQLLDHLVEVLLVGGQSGEQTRQTVNDDQS